MALQDFKKRLYEEKNYDFTLLYNARNIRRKCVPDLMLAWKIFVDELPKEKAEKCALVMHTQIVDDNGTDLQAVKDMMFGRDSRYNIIFDQNKYPSNIMNLLYNVIDATALVSSNEGWGLSLTEAMMCGKPIIATVTGGMQDQMRFEDENGKWIDFDENFCSNHFGTYQKCGEWTIPVFPKSMSVQGSVQTPYIFDDRIDFRDAADAIMKMYELGNEERKRRGKLAHNWVTSDESMMTAENMSKNVIKHVNKVLENWKPKPKFELIKTQPLKKKHLRHKLTY